MFFIEVPRRLASITFHAYRFVGFLPRAIFSAGRKEVLTRKGHVVQA